MVRDPNDTPTPRSRTLLCGGSGDPTVPPAVHMNVAQADFSSRGLTNVTSVDVDPTIRALFGIGGAAPTDPASAAFAAYFSAYHGTTSRRCATRRRGPCSTH